MSPAHCIEVVQFQTVTVCPRVIAADCPHRLDFHVELLLDESNSLDKQLGVFLGNLGEPVELAHAVGPELVL